MTYETILFEKKDGYAIITLNRPKVLNALSDLLVKELGQALDICESDNTIASVILTGSEKAFAAGADISEMKDKTFAQAYVEDFITNGWERITTCRKPIIAAVSGFALGGGCEVAMMCDFMIAADNARFGQPEITLGIIPGAGGTQRLTRAIGKAKAMDMILTGRQIDAIEAERSGLVSQVVPYAELLPKAEKAAAKIAKLSLPAIMMAKECVNKAFETTLTEGVRFERRVFQATFATNDQKEGMAAFLEKREANFNHS